MEPQDDLELVDRDGYVEARYLGTYALPRYLDQMARSVRACEERGRTLLLVDITDLQGYRPSTLERHQIGVTGAALSRGLSKVAALTTPEQVERNTDAKVKPADSEPFATTVARNRGLEIRAFVVRAAAVEWLLLPSRKS
ncbi:MAG TPA: hypothetical protein VF950_19105 [Planctomycetota bacterium]